MWPRLRSGVLQFGIAELWKKCTTLHTWPVVRFELLAGDFTSEATDAQEIERPPDNEMSERDWA
jgi:hypothetical protein